MLIRTGEMHDPAQGFLEAHELAKEAVRTRRRFLSAVTYPAFLCLLLLGVVLLTSWVLVPALSELFPPEQWAGGARVLFRASQCIQSSGGLWLLAGCVLLIGLIGYSLPNLTGRVRRVLDSLFPWSVYRMRSGATFLLVFARLLSSGMQAREVLSALLSHGCTPYAGERIAAILYHMARGVSPGAALAASGYPYPTKQIVLDLALYSRLPGFLAEIRRIAKESAEEVNDAIDRKFRVLGIVLLLVIAGCIAFILQAVVDLETQMGVLAL